MSESPKARFERVRQAYGPALTRVVASYARPGADHDDLAQEIAMALWRALPGFRGECPERAFVLRIAHNRGLAFLFRRPRHEPDAELEHKPDPAPRPEEQVAQREQVERLFAAIRALPPQYRQVLTLALEELPHAEIATVLGISAENVAVRLSRARAALRERLKEAP